MQKRPAINGLYAITPDLLDTNDLVHKVDLVIHGGASIIQYRNKSADADLRLVQASALRDLCLARNTLFIVNDDVLLAEKVDADGVHLGVEDGDIATARLVLGDHKLIGVSCYNRTELASSAEQKGADYVAFGAFFPSSTKPNAIQAHPELLGWARQHLRIPVVAIGGITLTNAAGLVKAGADALAVISAVFDAEDISLTAKQFTTLFEQGSV